MERFSKLGLLIDSEADLDIKGGQGRFLIQIFTKPLFFPLQNTFFLEILERRGARGFGSFLRVVVVGLKNCWTFFKLVQEISQLFNRQPNLDCKSIISKYFGNVWYF